MRRWLLFLWTDELNRAWSWLWKLGADSAQLLQWSLGWHWAMPNRPFPNNPQDKDLGVNKGQGNFSKRHLSYSPSVWVRGLNAMAAPSKRGFAAETGPRHTGWAVAQLISPPHLGACRRAWQLLSAWTDCCLQALVIVPTQMFHTAVKDRMATCIVSICICWENSSWEGAGSPVFNVHKENLPFSLHTSSEMFKYILHFTSTYDSLKRQFWDVGPRDKRVFNMFQESFPNFFSLHFTCFSPFFLALPVKTLWNP